jgi:hypothetical protein
MVCGVLKALIGTLSICVISSGASLHAECSVDTIIVNGRVEHAPRKGIVKVQLVYPKGRIGESADITVEEESFSHSDFVPHTESCSCTLPEWEYSPRQVHPETDNYRRFIDCQ